MLKRHSPDTGPERIGEVLSRLFTVRGWGRRSARLHVEKAWEQAAGPQFAEHTRLINIRRGVLEIEVDNAIMLQELAHYHKRRLLAGLRKSLPDMTLTDLRFRAGTWKR